jgi:hypothetical protein
MKKTIFILAATVVMTSCGPSFKQIGYLNMISTRNVSTKENYVNIKSYVGEDKKELKRNKGKTLDEAVTNLVKTVPGGEFIQNAKVYIIDATYYAVAGDVWGTTEMQNYKGFKVGDRVMWKDNFVKYTGVITDLKSDKECTVKQDENNKVRIVRYEEMSKI